MFVEVLRPFRTNSKNGENDYMVSTEVRASTKKKTKKGKNKERVSADIFVI